MTYSTLLITRQPGQDDGSVDPGGCKLMDSFGIFIQLCLAAAAFSTLLIKRQREQPRRPIRTWSLDVSKQLVGGIVIHTLNVVAAYFFGVKPEQGQQSNPCVWYFLNILVDCTIGVAILWITLRGFRYLTEVVFQWAGFQSGVYGQPPLLQQIKPWLKQLSIYTLSLLIMKTLVVLLFHLCPWLEDFGFWVLGWTAGNYKLQVAFVMLIFPLVMNIIQFWIIDTIVKHKDITQIRLNQRDDDDDDVENLLDSMEGQGHNYHHHQHQQQQQQSQFQPQQQTSPNNDSRILSTLLPSPTRQSKQKNSEDQRPLLSDSLGQRDSYDMDKENAVEVRQALDDHNRLLSSSDSAPGNIMNNNVYELGSPKAHRND
ncbi:vacuolar membrane protein-domain-containing protein [Chlamydoabsidia padenii]|nr:vacuolar membrane protein-domain-containing protein [Chlamydoabsidia padenii]